MNHILSSAAFAATAAPAAAFAAGAIELPLERVRRLQQELSAALADEVTSGTGHAYVSIVRPAASGHQTRSLVDIDVFENGQAAAAPASLEALAKRFRDDAMALDPTITGCWIGTDELMEGPRENRVMNIFLERASNPMVQKRRAEPDEELMALADQWRDTMEEWNTCGWENIDDHPAGARARELESSIEGIPAQTLQGATVKYLVASAFGDYALNDAAIVDDAVRLTGFNPWPTHPSNHPAPVEELAPAAGVEGIEYILNTLKNGSPKLRNDYLRMVRATSDNAQVQEFTDALERWIAKLA